METYRHIDAKPLTVNVGAEVSDVDLRQPSPEAQVDIRQALIDRKIMIFRNQDLSPHQYAEFMRIFGTPVKEDMAVDDGHPAEVGAIHIRPDEQQRINFWHMDHSFRDLPTPILSLYAKLLPPVGGHTLFASLEAAYEGLSKRMKERIEGLNCFHRVTTTQNTKRRHTAEEAAAMAKALPVLHPLVGLNPANGRKFLFVNVPIYCRSIAEMRAGRYFDEPVDAGDAG